MGPIPTLCYTHSVATTMPHDELLVGIPLVQIRFGAGHPFHTKNQTAPRNVSCIGVKSYAASKHTACVLLAAADDKVRKASTETAGNLLHHSTSQSRLPSTAPPASIHSCHHPHNHSSSYATSRYLDIRESQAQQSQTVPSQTVLLANWQCAQQKSYSKGQHHIATGIGTEKAGFQSEETRSHLTTGCDLNLDSSLNIVNLDSSFGPAINPIFRILKLSGDTAAPGHRHATTHCSIAREPSLQSRRPNWLSHGPARACARYSTAT